MRFQSVSIRWEYVLTLNLFGHVLIACDGETIHFRSQAEAALLIYLAHTGKNQTRESVADLFWEARNTQQALGNLRTALARLRKHAGDELVVTQKTLAVASSMRQQIDSVRFKNLTEQITYPQSKAKAMALLETINLYSGDFLGDFYLPDAPRFNDWAVVEQEYLRLRLFSACEHLIRYALENKDYSPGIAAARQWLKYDLWTEAVHVYLIRLLAASGQKSEAIAQYARCVKMLATEFAISPDPATIRIYEQIQAGEWANAATPVLREKAVPHNLPTETKPFFGRFSELANLSLNLLDPTYPLVTLSGEGGIGKTRLALAAAHRILTANTHPFDKGVWFVPLASLTPTIPPRDALAEAISQSLQMTNRKRGTPAEQVLAYLKEKSCLLVLDKFDALLNTKAVDYVLELLQQAPQLRLLVTSQTRLNLYAEFVVQLSGLPVPTNPAQDAASYASVQLFIEGAKRSTKDFVLGDQLQHVIDICRLTKGIPLEIELCAARVSVNSCAEIAQALRINK